MPNSAFCQKSRRDVFTSLSLIRHRRFEGVTNRRLPDASATERTTRLFACAGPKGSGRVLLVLQEKRVWSLRLLTESNRAIPLRLRRKAQPMGQISASNSKLTKHGQAPLARPPLARPQAPKQESFAPYLSAIPARPFSTPAHTLTFAAA